MKIDNHSIRFKVIIPIFILITVITLSLLFIIYRVSERVSEDYHMFAVSKHSTEIHKVLDRALTELTSAQLLDEAVVVDEKKKAAVDEIYKYWAGNRLDGLIQTSEGRILSPSGGDFARKLEPVISSGRTGHFHITKGTIHVQGYIIDFPAWNWKVITVSRPSTLILKNELVFLLPLIIFAAGLMLITVFVILKKNFEQPVERIISGIQSGLEIEGTGITEIDTVGATINDSFRKLNKKTEQYQALHEIAVSLHDDLSADEVLNLIIDKASAIMNAELSAIALYDEKGHFRKLFVRGVSINTKELLPEGKGILEFIRFSLAPVRINNLLDHHAFSGSFPNGHPVVRNLLGYPMFSDEGRPVGSFYFGNKEGDFTEEDETVLKAICADASIVLGRAEKLTQLRKFKQLIDSAFDVIVITDRDGLITYVNPAFETVTGYSGDEAFGKKTNILKSGYHDDAFYRRLWDSIKTGNIWRGEFINRKKNGETYFASSVIFPIQIEGETNFASIQRDVTQEKRLYEQLLRAQKMDAIGTLAGGIAHDFNNLLTAILGYSEIMMTTAKEGDQFYKPVTIIQNAAEKGADLARKILTITRKEKMETKPVDLNEIIRNAMELLQRSLPRKIEIVTVLGENLPMIKADPSQIQQVVMNLCVNARDAMPDGGKLAINTSVVGVENGAAGGMTDGEGGGLVKLSIADTGIGMDSETQRRIFDPFFTTKETGKGTGLGLYIVHSIVNNHGGYLNLYSVPSKGTQFNIYLPVTSDEATTEPVKAEEIRGSGTILVIDDEPDIRELCRDILEPLGYEVLLAVSGSDGINIFRQMKDRVSLVVLDMIMPKMGGSEVFQALRNMKQDVKILLCSGYSQEGFAGIDKLLMIGRTSFVQKPFTRRSLGQSIKKMFSE